MTRLKLICFFSIILFYTQNYRVYGQDSLAIKQEIKIDSSHVDPVIFSDNAIENLNVFNNAYFNDSNKLSMILLIKVPDIYIYYVFYLRDYFIFIISYIASNVL